MRGAKGRRERIVWRSGGRQSREQRAAAGDRHGYAIPATAKTQCSLCYEVRRFLRPYYPRTFGPAELYDE